MTSESKKVLITRIGGNDLAAIAAKPLGLNLSTLRVPSLEPSEVLFYEQASLERQHRKLRCLNASAKRPLKLNATERV